MEPGGRPRWAVAPAMRFGDPRPARRPRRVPTQRYPQLRGDRGTLPGGGHRAGSGCGAPRAHAGAAADGGGFLRGSVLGQRGSTGDRQQGHAPKSGPSGRLWHGIAPSPGKMIPSYPRGVASVTYSTRKGQTPPPIRAISPSREPASPLVQSGWRRARLGQSATLRGGFEARPRGAGVSGQRRQRDGLLPAPSPEGAAQGGAAR